MQDDPLARVEGSIAEGESRRLGTDDPWGDSVWEADEAAPAGEVGDDLDDDPTAEAIAAVAAGEAARAALVDAAPLLDDVADLIRDVDAAQGVTQTDLDASAATDPEGPRATDDGRPIDDARRELIGE